MAECIATLEGYHDMWIPLAHDLAGRPRKVILERLRARFDVIPYKRMSLIPGDIVLWDMSDGTLHVTRFTGTHFQSRLRGITRELPLRTYAPGVCPAWIIRLKETT